ncbi:hypothetical protein BC941DRAFT_433554 [Chlamydoabsidia padenii]|nr:hypothetical protein BC941DRAFT_433554 [Chlamydoabsidia padenii]
MLSRWLLLLLTTTFTFTLTQSSQLRYQPETVDYIHSNEQSLFDKLAPESDLSIFLELLMHNDLLFTYFNSTTTTSTNTILEGQSIHEEHSFTVFAPTNQAFLDYWKTQPKKTWKKILERHVVPHRRLGVTELMDTHILNTLLPGATIHVNLQQQQQQGLQHPRILLDGDTLVNSNRPIQSTLSIAYKINHVLPSFYLD